MHWLAQGMIKTEQALLEILKVPDYKDEVVANTKVHRSPRLTATLSFAHLCFKYRKYNLEEAWTSPFLGLKMSWW